MAKDCKMKINGTWKSTAPMIKVNGAWKPATKGYIKVNGAWVMFYEKA